MRRVVIAPLAMLMVLAVPGVGLAGEVADMLEDAAGADFHGSGIVMCNWGSDSAAATYEVTRTAGMSMIEGPDGAAMSYAGVAARRSGSDWYGTEVEEWTAWAVADRYTLGEKTEITRMGRPALIVTVLEEGAPRVRMILDSESTVPLLTEILDADGDVFRMAALTDFQPGPTDMSESMPDVEMMNMVRPASATTGLPDSAAGYVRVDTYDAGDGAVHAFYTDGIFSFSVFEADRSGRPAAFDGATEFETGGNRYRRIVTPTSLWVHWSAPNHSYVLVGDLPPDHLIRVLDHLPEPGQPAFLVRLWRALFG